MTQPKTWAHPKTLAEWRDRIVMSLGGAAWNVELTPDNLDHAIWQTLILYNKFMPLWRWRPLGEVFNQVSFDFSDEEVGTRVVDVKFKHEDNRFTHHASPQYQHRYGFLNMRNARMAHKSLVAKDRYRHFLGVQPEWKYDDESRTLFLVSFASFAPTLATALLLVPNRVENIPFHREYDFLGGAVGHSKIILARILGKYGDIPSAQGSIQ